MKVALEKPGTPEELAHHGVKGMKWGVRKAYARRMESYAGVRRAIGFKKSADKLSAHAQRIANGEATTRDKLKMYGNVSMSDVINGRRLSKQANTA